MRFWTEVDGLLLRQAAKHADAIRAAFIRSIDVEDIVQRWVEAHPAGGVVSAAEARTWAKQNIPVERKPLGDALDHVYATGWIMGQDASTAAYAHAQLGVQKAAPSAKQMTAALNTNWNTWKPGNKPAALLVRPSGKFAQLLETGRAGIKGMNDTTLDRVGTLLADSLESGKAYSDLARNLLKDQITSRVVQDASRATTIAVTEMSRALNTATVDNYNQFGVEKVEWLAIDTGVCEICPANEAQGPIPIGEMFESGDTEPPAHPNCRCTILPVVAEGPEMTDEQFAQAIIDGDTSAVSEAITPVETAALPPIQGSAPVMDLTAVQTESLREYTGAGAVQINAKLRGYDPQTPAAFRISKDKIESHIKAIDSAMKNASLPGPIDVRRDTLVEAFGGEKKIMGLVGKTIKDKGFLSTTTSVGGSSGAGTGDVIMRIHAPAGAKAIDVKSVSQHKRENEVLFARNTELRIDNVTYNSRSMKYTVDATVVVK